jgi:hypothetical protein
MVVGIDAEQGAGEGRFKKKSEKMSRQSLIFSVFLIVWNYMLRLFYR